VYERQLDRVSMVRGQFFISVSLFISYNLSKYTETHSHSRAEATLDDASVTRHILDIAVSSTFNR